MTSRLTDTVQAVIKEYGIKGVVLDSCDVDGWVHTLKSDTITPISANKGIEPCSVECIATTAVKLFHKPSITECYQEDVGWLMDGGYYLLHIEDYATDNMGGIMTVRPLPWHKVQLSKLGITWLDQYLIQTRYSGTLGNRVALHDTLLIGRKE